MNKIALPIHGRGISENPANRFDQIAYEIDEYCADEDRPSPMTKFYRDKSRTIIAYNDSPDIPFSASINPYRGCEHACSYCYARPTHEYLGFSAGLDFETKILVKEDAPELLRQELASPRWQPQVINMSGVTDAYQPIERKLQLTRRCLEVLLEFRNPVTIVTKNHLVARDVDLLSELAKRQAAVVFLSLTTLDSTLRQKMEPRTSHPSGRLQALRTLADAGIPVGVMTAPMIPGLNDHELPALLEAAADAGATHAGYTMLRLSHGLREMFATWLEQHFPHHKEKVLGRVMDVRDGKLNDTRFGVRMRGEGLFAETIAQLFKTTCKKLGLNKRDVELSTASFRRSKWEQTMLFD